MCKRTRECKIAKKDKGQRGQDERKCPKRALRTITRSTGENEYQALRHQHTDKSSAPITRRNILSRTKRLVSRGCPLPIPLIRKLAYEASIGRTGKQQSTSNWPGSTHHRRTLSWDRSAPIASGISRSRRTCTSGTEKGGDGGRQGSIRTEGTSCTAHDPDDYAPERPDRPTAK